MKTNFTTVMASELVDELDECFSPMDGIEAIDQMSLELPQLHRPARRGIFHRLRSGKIYYGRYDWYPLGFRYVQIGNELHVRDLFLIAETGFFRRRRFDVILGRSDGEFRQTYEPCRHLPGSADHE